MNHYNSLNLIFPMNSMNYPKELKKAITSPKCILATYFIVLFRIKIENLIYEKQTGKLTYHYIHNKFLLPNIMKITRKVNKKIINIVVEKYSVVLTIFNLTFI